MTSAPQSPANDPVPTHRRVSWTSPEIVGELILLGLIAILVIVFLFQVVALPVGQDCADERSTPAAPISCFLFQSAPDLAERFSIPNLRLPGRWLPLIAIGIGTPLWFIRLYTVLRRRKAIEEGMIMDLGFRLGEDPEGEKRRAFLYFGTLILLVLAVWMIGFHAGLPLWVMGYLVFWTRMRWYFALPIGIAFEAFIVGILDLTLDIFWFEPLFFRWIGVEYPVNEWFTRAF